MNMSMGQSPPKVYDLIYRKERKPPWLNSVTLACLSSVKEVWPESIGGSVLKFSRIAVGSEMYQALTMTAYSILS